MSLFVVHVSDTHFAFDNEKLLASTLVSAPQLPLAPFFQKLRASVIRSHGCACAEARLWSEMLAELKRIGTAIEDDMFALHTGDVTQAGQMASLVGALDEITQALGNKVFAIAGNHDQWPEDFPPCRPNLTAAQYARLRQCAALANPIPTWHPLATSPSVDVMFLNSAVADSLPNALALGKLEDEVLAGQLVPQLGPAWPGSSPLRAVALHHPVIDFGQGVARRTQAYKGWQLAMVLQDRAAVWASLLKHEVGLVFCGHEHLVPGGGHHVDPTGRVLQLAAGCPTLVNGAGNHDEPQFALYQLDQDGGDVVLTWYVCRLDPVRWAEEARYRYSGKRWSVESPSTGLPAFVSGQKARAPLAS